MKVNCALPNYIGDIDLDDYFLKSLNHLILVRNQEEKELLLGELFIKNIPHEQLRIYILRDDEVYHYTRGTRRPYYLTNNEVKVARIDNGDVLISWVSSSPIYNVVSYDES
ncbi:hypothetical protein P4b_00032 [Klebsiella phage VLCpiP4b]|nr:hypothetical protein P4b_00032 [Klebsiella phage VLCpiP4b]